MNNNISILYVDDEPINLQVFQYTFEEKYNIITSESGIEGLEILKSNPEVKLVISDMKMPGMSGVEFIRIAKKEFPSIKYYILTGFDITKEIADALNEKIILKYFRKPFNTREIEAVIEEALKQ